MHTVTFDAPAWPKHTHGEHIMTVQAELQPWDIHVGRKSIPPMDVYMWTDAATGRPCIGIKNGPNIGDYLTPGTPGAVLLWAKSDDNSPPPTEWEAVAYALMDWGWFSWTPNPAAHFCPRCNELTHAPGGDICRDCHEEITNRVILNPLPLG